MNNEEDNKKNLDKIKTAISEEKKAQESEKIEEKKEKKEEESKKIISRRLDIISDSIKKCFFIFGACIVIILFSDVIFNAILEKSFDLANSHIFTILIAVISTTLTTLVGVVIGSSIER